MTFNEFYGLEPVGLPFGIFSPAHLSALAVIVVVVALSSIVLQQNRCAAGHRFFRYTVAFLLIAQELV